MSQKSLIPEDDALVREGMHGAKNTALADLRTMALQVPAETLVAALTEYDERRKTFREWLMGQLIEGVHYGYPPGTEPQFDEHGNMLAWDSKAKCMKAVPKSSWQKTPSLYEAGADFIAELMGVRVKVEADNDLWQQLGGNANRVCFRCELISRQTGDTIGEGHGAAKVVSVGKIDEVNKAVMIGRKRAKVKAVRDAYGLSDLFAQDLEDVDSGPADHPAPAVDENAPRDTPRGNRVESEQVVAVVQEYKSQFPDVDEKQYFEWCRLVTGRDFDFRKPDQWTSDDLNKVCTALGIPV